MAPLVGMLGGAGLLLIWWSAWERNPAYTSAIREKSRFSSSDNESHGRVTSRGGNG